jgi:hypothetical protein
MEYDVIVMQDVVHPETRELWIIEGFRYKWHVLCALMAEVGADDVACKVVPAA